MWEGANMAPTRWSVRDEIEVHSTNIVVAVWFLPNIVGAWEIQQSLQGTPRHNISPAQTDPDLVLCVSPRCGYGCHVRSGFCLNLQHNPPTDEPPPTLRRPLGRTGVESEQRPVRGPILPSCPPLSLRDGYLPALHRSTARPVPLGTPYDVFSTLA